MTTTTYLVTGMTCEHCTRAVTSELQALDGVTAVTVALVPGGPSAVTVSSAAPLSADAVAGALDEAGDYRVASEADIAARAAGIQAPAGRVLPLA
jgi:copper chaperone CopZ